MSLPKTLDECDEVVILDTEYVHEEGERLDPVCLAWKLYPEGCMQVARREEVLRWKEVPFPVGPKTVCVAYNAGAEAAFLMNLDVPQPMLWYDVMVEEAMLRNVAVSKTRRLAFAKRHPELFKPGSTIGLLEAARLYGVECGEQIEKEQSQALIQSRAWESGDEAIWQEIEQYCMSDVVVTEQLFAKLEPRTMFAQAVVRGSYAAEVGRMAQRGIPADQTAYQRLCEQYKNVLVQYRRAWDAEGVRLTPRGSIRPSWWEQKLASLGRTQRYPRTKTGKASTKREHVLRLAREREDDGELVELAGWLELKKLLPERKAGEGLRVPALGTDGRFRYDMFAFGTHTGRSLGKSNEAIMQMVAWMRGFISPPQGEVLVYLDFEGQEVAIAAALSKDEELRRAYESGDVYTAIARMAGAITVDTSEEEARRARRAYKVLTLGRNYGMSFRSFWEKSGVSQAAAARAWQFFLRRFSRLDRWQRQSLEQARQRGWMQTRWGWRAAVYPDTRRTALLNWPIQAAGADVLRMAVLRAAAEGFDVLAVAYDAMLVSVPEAGAEVLIAELQGIVEEAAELTVGVRIRVGCQAIRPSERFLTEETRQEWEKVIQALERVA
jgi:DNA polymerase-1